ncbi:hypothetical protein EIN_371630 [Entamoeba invadens IP1]|uniref:Uncharacterized protein n=1 Tax=Entamoeba invadens IP1 TaxID=370355 RepID=A0A0A1UC02_ENTIV|nr:hypothetical protein EIN_371630 [Entamoeba invadens IP1]ELP92751.1 hypothetical protein EIN_371630 [Entamoeba invadens IP1]|eukprot:XP_004259522.1 hypothetical protein EIN_371630 [Entamoeba invadens IP1]
MFSSWWKSKPIQQQTTPAVVQQTQPKRTDKLMTLVYLDLHDDDTIFLLQLMAPLQSVDFVVLMNVHPTLLKDEAIVKRIQLSHPHLHPPLSSFKKELPATLLFSKFVVSETVPFNKMPTVFARKTQLKCDIVRLSLSDIYADASLSLVVFELDKAVNEKENVVEDYVPVTLNFIQQYELNLIGKMVSTLQIPNYGKSAVLYCGNFHETSVIDSEVTLGTIDKDKLSRIVDKFIAEKEKVVDGTDLVSQLEAEQIPIKESFSYIYERCKNYKTLNAAVLAESVALSVSEYVISSVRLLPYKDIGTLYLSEAIWALNMARKLWAYSERKVNIEDPSVASFLNRINKAFVEMKIPIEIENFDIHFSMFLVAIQRWLKLKIKSAMKIALLTGTNMRELTVNDFILTDDVFPNFSSSKLSETKKINGDFFGLCYSNNLMPLVAFGDQISDSVLTIDSQMHVLNLTNLQNSEIGSKSSFADMQCIQYMQVPSAATNIQLPQGVNGIFTRFAIYPVASN